MQILDGEKLLKFVEKCRWNIFRRPERGQQFFGRVSDRFSDLFSCFSNRFSYRFKRFAGAVSRERKMRTKFFCTNFLNTARGPGHPGKIPGTSRIPLFETQGRQSFEGGHEVFGHHPFAWKTPTPPSGLRTQKLNLCALFSCLSFVLQTCRPNQVHSIAATSSALTRRDATAASKGNPGPQRWDHQSVALSCTRLRVPPVALHLSRYTCRN